ncbi:MAG: universal stress protein, partial [Verrucomicrobiales bacterium]
MQKISNILVGTDFSESSHAALVESRRIAQSVGAELTVLHVIDEELTEILKQKLGMPESELIKIASERLADHVREVLGDTDKITLEALIGCPFVEIVRSARSRAADLLVLGSGGSETNGVHAGVLARRCVRKVPAKVLLVRQNQQKPFSRVVACVDFSDNSIEAIELAAQVAQQEGAILQLLHVCRPVVPSVHGDRGTFAGTKFFDISLPPYPEMNYAQKQKEKLDDLARELLEKDYPDLEVESHVFTDGHRPSHGIVEFLKDSKSELVVLGTRGRTGVRSLLMGTTAERIVDHSPCSVLA